MFGVGVVGGCGDASCAGVVIKIMEQRGVEPLAS